MGVGIAVIVGMITAEPVVCLRKCLRRGFILLIGFDILTVTHFIASHINDNTGNAFGNQKILEGFIGSAHKIHDLTLFQNHFAVTVKIDGFRRIAVILQRIFLSQRIFRITVTDDSGFGSRCHCILLCLIEFDVIHRLQIGLSCQDMVIDTDTVQIRLCIILCF